MNHVSLNTDLCSVVKRLTRGRDLATKAPLYARAAELVAAGANVNQKIGRKGPLLGMILRLQSVQEKENLVRAFLKHGADPNAPVTGLFVELHADGMNAFRVHFTHLTQIPAAPPLQPGTCGKLVTLLVRSGAELNSKTREGLTAFDLAMWQLWKLERYFEHQKIRFAKRYYSDELDAACDLIGYTPSALELVGTIRDLGGIPSMWSPEQVDNCTARMNRVYDVCREARLELIARAAEAGADSEVYFNRTIMKETDPVSFARMNVGDPTALIRRH